MTEHGGHGGAAGADLLSTIVTLVALAVGIVAIVGYLRWAAADRRRWPRWRSCSWSLGCLLAAITVSGRWGPGFGDPFVDHMAGHLLLGMIAPVLLVVAAPITLLLRSLPVPAARRLTALLRSRPIRFLTEPVVAAILNVGGLWVLYLTPLYALQHHHPALQLVVHLHMLASGCLFTAAVVSVDPWPHRRSFLHRATVLILALAAHDVLAKALYANPPDGVSAAAAQQAAQVMYYGGDAVDLVLIVVLCTAWYRARRPRSGQPILPRLDRPAAER